MDETKFKKLVVDALQLSLKKQLVNSGDVINQLKAQGLTTRECVGEASEVPRLASEASEPCDKSAKRRLTHALTHS